MTTKLYVRRGGGPSSVDTEYTDLNPSIRKGAPIFDHDTPLIQLGMRFENGESSQGYFKVSDPNSEIPTSTFRLPPHALVTLTEDASGDELWLARGRVAPLEAGRGTTAVQNEVEYDVTVNDGNMDLRGQPFTEDWVRPAETGRARVGALQLYILNGASSTAPDPGGDPGKRVTTDITVLTPSGGHLAPNSDLVTMPKKTYPSGTQPVDVIADCAETEDKIYGVVIHHTGGTSHLCLLYIKLDDHTTYASDVKISQVLSEHDPDDPTAPVFEPHYLAGKGSAWDHDQVVTALVSRWGGTNDEPRTVVALRPSLIDDYEYWGESYDDSESETEAQAEARAAAILNTHTPSELTNRCSILMSASQTHLIAAGMSLQIKAPPLSTGALPSAYSTRRIAELKWEPNPDGRWWAHMQLGRGLNRRGAGKTNRTQPRSTSPKPAPDVEPTTGDSVEGFFNANDAGGDTLSWDGILANQGGVGSGLGANGTDFYYFKSSSPDHYSHTRAWAAGDQMVVTGWNRGNMVGTFEMVFTNLAAGTNGTSVVPGVILDGSHTLATPNGVAAWVAFSAGPFTAPVGTTSYAFGRTSSSIVFDEVTVTLVGTPDENDEEAVNYDGYPHDSPFYLPSDYVEARLDEIQALAAAGDLLDWYVVTDAAYGAAGDGTTDDAAAIQAAIDAAGAAGGGVVYLPEATYLVGTTLTLDSVNVTLRGAGSQASYLKADTGLASSDVVQVTSSYCNLIDLQITSASQKSGGVGISFSGASYCSVDRVRTLNQYHAIKINTGVVIRISNCDLRDTVKNGVWITGTSGNDFFLSKVVADNTPDSTGSGILIDVTSEGATWVEDCDFINFADGLKIAPASGTTRWHFFVGSAFDQSTNDGIHLGGAGGAVHGVTFNNCWSATSANQGIYIGTGVSGVNWVGGRIINNGQNGVGIATAAAASHLIFADSLIVGNSVSSSGTYHGINVAAGTTHLTISGNQAFNGLALSSTQGYGLSFASGATDYVQIVGNDFSGNVTGEINNLAGISGTHVTFLPELSGTSTTYLNGIGAFSTPSSSPTGAAGGDLSGTYPNPSVVDDSHSHTAATLPTSSGGVGEILIADTHSTPLIFGDLLQNEDEDNLLYADA